MPQAIRLRVVLTSDGKRKLKDISENSRTWLIEILGFNAKKAMEFQKFLTVKKIGKKTRTKISFNGIERIWKSCKYWESHYFWEIHYPRKKFGTMWIRFRFWSSKNSDKSNRESTKYGINNETNFKQNRVSNKLL